ncbi:unnamed protein product [Rhodiola kirilowii]
MSSSLLSVNPLLAARRLNLASQFVNPNPIRHGGFCKFINPNALRSCSRGCNKVSKSSVFVVRSSSAESEQQPTVKSSGGSGDVFGGVKELSGVQSFVDTLSPPVRLATSVIVVAGALAAGYGLGLKIGGTRNTALGGAVSVGLAGGAVAYALNSCVPEVAAVNLHNYVAGSDDPLAISKEDIEGIANRYGVSKQNEAFNSELCDLYCR